MQFVDRINRVTSFWSESSDSMIVPVHKEKTP